MSLEEYGAIVFHACKLNVDDPIKAWADLAGQQHLVDYLNRCSSITYKNSKSDITFSVKDRIWINSDGKANMPSGEVYTGPIEDSVNGHIHFDVPSIYQGKEIRGITLEVKDGNVVSWTPNRGVTCWIASLRSKGLAVLVRWLLALTMILPQHQKHII